MFVRINKNETNFKREKKNVRQTSRFLELFLFPSLFTRDQRTKRKLRSYNTKIKKYRVPKLYEFFLIADGVLIKAGTQRQRKREGRGRRRRGGGTVKQIKVKSLLLRGRRCLARNYRNEGLPKPRNNCEITKKLSISIFV